ncbi:MAG: SDR family oxidoreductase [Acidobacteria bacterium]|jgi:3-oxoacyl-[acyl-carrier protein] reductase|nr:SDR family oxidoreductase [Acidobacteriota bacterium]
MDLQLRDKVAIVTGSSKGLGLASARALVAEGARVVLCARGADALAAAAADLRALAGREDVVETVQADVSTVDGCEAIVAKAVQAFGAVDILVNNVAKAEGSDLMSTPDSEWTIAVDHTLFPVVRCSRLVVPLMRERAGGVILTIASIFGRESGGRTTYNAVKAAQISLSKSMAQQLAKDNIRVNSIAPGSILFEGGTWWKRQQDNPAKIAAFVAQEMPFGRFGKADEVGDVVAFLASPRASWISGACITVDGCQSRSNI